MKPLIIWILVTYNANFSSIEEMRDAVTCKTKMERIEKSNAGKLRADCYAIMVGAK